MDEIERLSAYLDDLNAGRALETTLIADGQTTVLLRQARRVKVAAEWDSIAPDPGFSAALEEEILAHLSPAAREAISLSPDGKDGLAGDAGRSKDNGWRGYRDGHPLARWWQRLAPWTRRSFLPNPSPSSRPIAPSQNRGRAARPAWKPALTTALVLLLLAALLVAVLGPQRVLAEIQRLLWRYVPGIGFVDAGEARLLVEPVAVARDGVTLHLAQIVAQRDGTVVALTAAGLPQMEQGERDNAGLQASLELSDGRSLPMTGSSASWGEAQIRFPALPAAVMSGTLSLERLPLAQPGQLPEGWRIPFTLRSAASAVAADVFPRAYEPVGAEETHNGVTLRVLRVAHSAEATAVQVEARWQNQAWYLRSLGDRQLPTLSDDLGHVYGAPSPRPRPNAAVTTQEGPITTVQQVTVVQVQPGEPSQMPQPGSAEQTLPFTPVSSADRRLTLAMSGAAFSADSPYGPSTPLSLDLGIPPQIGQHWPFDCWLEVDGFTVHLTGLRLEQASVQFSDGERPAFLLHFEVEPLPEHAGIRLESVCFTPRQGETQQTYGAHCGDDRQAPGIIFAQLPAGVLAVEARASQIVVSGPWELTWDVQAGAAGLPPAPVPHTFRPAGAVSTASGLTLRLQETTLTDRLTALTIELDGAPGTELYRVPGRLPQQGLSETSMHDEQGRRYGPALGIGWQPDGGLIRRPNVLYMEPVVSPGARLQLELPSVEIFVPGRVGFDVHMPPGIKVDIQDGLARSASKPPQITVFDVDISLDLGGYHWRLRRGQVGPTGGSGLLMLAPSSSELGQGRQLAGYCVSAVTTPSGKPATPGTGALPPERCDSLLGFVVGDPETGIVEPGTYHVEMEGIVVAVPGPWRLSWEIPGH